MLQGEDSLLGLYNGVPLVERDSIGPPLPDRIILYRRSILRRCNTAEQVVEEVRTTLWHEVGHYLGLSEADLHRLGYG